MVILFDSNARFDILQELLTDRMRSIRVRVNFSVSVVDLLFSVDNNRCLILCLNSNPQFGDEMGRVHRFLSYFLFFGMSLFGLTAFAQSDELDQSEYSLRTLRTKGVCDLVEVLLEVVGEVKQVTTELKEVNEKMEVVAGFRYEERVDEISSEPNGTSRSFRQYDLARAKMNIGDQRKNPELDRNQRSIICEVKNAKTNFFSPNIPLKSEQMLLVEGLPGNTIIIDCLLPEKDVKVGDSWTIPNETLAAFLYIDTIRTNNTKAVLTAVADDIALVEIVGDVEGSYLGAFTEQKVHTKYQFDLKSGRIVWLGLLNDIKRSIGHAGPGIEVRARLQMKILPIEEPKILTDSFVKNLKTDPGKDILQLRYENEGRPWAFRHDREWFFIMDDPKSTILRRIVDGELIAQCQIQDMGTVSKRNMPSLESFRMELEKGLSQAKSNAMTVLKNESTHIHGYTQYTVILDGSVDEKPLRWIYYLLTDSRGNQRIIVFVLDESNIEAFGEEDDVFVQNFQIRTGF